MHLFPNFSFIFLALVFSNLANVQGVSKYVFFEIISVDCEKSVEIEFLFKNLN